MGLNRRRLGDGGIGAGWFMDYAHVQVCACTCTCRYLYRVHVRADICTEYMYMWIVHVDICTVFDTVLRIPNLLRRGGGAQARGSFP